MNFDYYAFLDDINNDPNKRNKFDLVSGFSDECLVWSCRDKKAKNNARQRYMKRASNLEDLKLPADLNFEPDFSKLPDPSWIGIEVKFKLLSPWYSKDDRPFHVLDNPVRKDRVFGVPFMSASSWKGMLRWACLMQEELLNHLATPDIKQGKCREDQNWIIHLFGNEREKDEDFKRGALQFYPTWFDKVGFEVINPHSRKSRAGIQPIYYEVVPAGREAELKILYAPTPGQIERDKIKPIDTFQKFVAAIKSLLTQYGISAKRTSGWGAAQVLSCRLFYRKDSWFEEIAGPVDEKKYEYVPPADVFKNLMNANGSPLEILLDDNKNLRSLNQFRKLKDKKPDCTKAEYKEFINWYEKHGEDYRRQLNGIVESELPEKSIDRFFGSLNKLEKLLLNARKGGDQ